MDKYTKEDVDIILKWRTTHDQTIRRIRYTRACSFYADVLYSARLFTIMLLIQGYADTRLKSSLHKFNGHHHEFMDRMVHLSASFTILMKVMHLNWIRWSLWTFLVSEGGCLKIERNSLVCKFAIYKL